MDIGNKIELQLAPNVTLCAETFRDEYNEIMIYIKKDDMIWQDLAIIGPEYTEDSNGNVNINSNDYLIRVFGDSSSEDYTDLFNVCMREEEME